MRGHLEERLDEEIDGALRVALEQLRLELGIVSRIAGDDYEVLNVVAPETLPLVPGQRFSLGQTYCSITYAADDVVTIDEMGASPHRSHPAYASIGLESYIGVPLRVDGERVGTLNFSSAKRRDGDFGPLERGFVRLVASWVERSFERRRLLGELAGSLARFRTVFEESADPIFFHRDGRLLEVNRATATLVGAATPEEIVGTSVLDFVDDSSVLPALAKRLERLARGEHPGTPIELRLRRLTGEVRYVESFGVPIELEDGRAALTIARDVTDRKRAEQQVMHANRLASIGSLAAGVAHELNNPLAYVIANLDIVLEQLAGDSPTDVSDALREAREGAERARHIVRELRTFSRIEDERRAPRDVHGMLDVASNLAGNQIRHRARLVKDYGEVPRVDADEARITQVFVNLLVNAAQAIEPGSANDNEIRVSTRPVDEGVEILIEDTGAGISAYVLPRMFDAFVSTKPREVGTGLGLPLSLSIVRSHGGTIAARNREGGGASLRVVLPASGGAQPSIAPPPTQSSTASRRGRVLLIDDDAMVRRSVKRVLRSRHDVSPVASGPEALAHLTEDDAYDVVLCDLMMPEMPGWQLFDELERRSPQLARRVIFITGGALHAEGTRFLARVPNLCLEKPFDMKDLRAAIDAAVAERDQRP